MGQHPTSATTLVDFLVVDKPLTYNSIIGRTTLGAIQAVSSIYHLKLKFLTPHCVGEEKGYQGVAQGCYYMALSGMRGTEACQVLAKVDNMAEAILFHIEKEDTEDARRPQVAEELEEVEVPKGKVVKISV